MSWTKEPCACVAEADSIDFLHESNSRRQVIMLPATKSNQPGQQDQQWPFYSLSSSPPHIFSVQRCVQAHNTEGLSGMFTIARSFSITLAKKMEGYVGEGRCTSGKLPP